MKRAVIIQGTSGAGKTTTARKIALSLQAVLLAHDYFLFNMQPDKPKYKERHTLGNNNMRTCFDSFVASKRNIVMEGFLGSLDLSTNDIDVNQYLAVLKENEYKITRVFIHCPYEIAKERILKRLEHDEIAAPISKDLFEKIEKVALENIPNTVHQIDASNKDESEVFEEVLSVVKNS